MLTGGPAGGQGYLLAPSGDILTGSLTGSPWRYTGKAPCPPGAASGSGAPLGAQLAAGSTRLLINCTSSASGTGGARTGTGSGSQQTKTLFESSSSGARWRKVSQPPADGQATSLATASQGQVVLATTTGIDFSTDGTTWQAATITDGAPAGGFQLRRDDQRHPGRRGPGGRQPGRGVRHHRRRPDLDRRADLRLTPPRAMTRGR